MTRPFYQHITKHIKLVVCSSLLIVALLFSMDEVLAQNKKAVQQELTFVVNNYQTDTMTINNKKYKFNSSAKKLFTASNASTLKGAQITLEVKNDIIIRIKDIQLHQSGTKIKPLLLNAAITIDSLTVNAAYLHMENISVKSNVIVTNKAAGKITLENMFINRQILMQGTSSHESTKELQLQLPKTSVRQVIVERASVDVIATRKIPNVIVTNNVPALHLNAAVTKLTIENNPTFFLNGNASIYNIVAIQKSNVTLNCTGTLQYMTFHHSSSSLRLNSNMKISNIELPFGSQVTKMIHNFTTVQPYIGKIFVGWSHWKGEQVIGVESIKVTSLPLNTKYLSTDTVLNLNGMTVVAQFAENKTEIVTAYTTSQVDFTKLGEQTVTVMYGGKTATFTITISAPTTFNYVAMSHVTNLPIGVSYQNNKFSLSGFLATSFTFKDGVTLKKAELVKGRWQVLTIK